MHHNENKETFPKAHARKISVVIPCYNSSHYVRNTLKYPLSDKRIDDIVLSDDASSDCDILQKIIVSFQSPKINFFRNSQNLGGCRNKAIAASHAKNEWVVVLDSDNTIGEKYLDAIFSLDNWDPRYFYCAENGLSLPHFDWHDFTRTPIDLNIFGMYVTEGTTRVNFLKQRFYRLFFRLPHLLRQKLALFFLKGTASRFLALMNDGNCFVNRDRYLETHQAVERLKLNPYAADVILVNYLWLKQGNGIRVVPGMEYYHAIRADSYWAKTVNNYVKVVRWIVNDLHSARSLCGNATGCDTPECDTP